MPPNNLSGYTWAQLRAMERQYLPLSQWTYEELAAQERALLSAAAAQASSPDLTAGEGLRAAGRGAMQGLGNLARAVAEEPFIRDNVRRLTPSRETVATALDTIPGPAVGIPLAMSGYGLPAAAAMAGSAAALGRAGANAVRGVEAPMLEPAVYGAIQGLAMGVPLAGRMVPARLAVRAPNLAAAAELGGQMAGAGATGTALAALYQGANGQEIDWREALKVGGVTALLGGIGGAVRAHDVRKLAMADRDGLVIQARKLGFEGKGFDEMRVWYREAEDAADILTKGRQQNARPVGANAPAEEGAMVPTWREAAPPARPAAPAIVPPAIVPTSPRAAPAIVPPAMPAVPVEIVSSALQLNHNPAIGWSLYGPEGKVVNHLGHVNGGKDVAAAIEEAHVYADDNRVSGAINVVERVQQTKPVLAIPPAAPAPAPRMVTPADDFNLASASVEQQAAEAQGARDRAVQQAQREAIEIRANRPLTGDSSDVGQGVLLNSEENLFSGQSAERAAPPAVVAAPAPPAAMPAELPPPAPGVVEPSAGSAMSHGDQEPPAMPAPAAPANPKPSTRREISDQRRVIRELKDKIKTLRKLESPTAQKFQDRLDGAETAKLVDLLSRAKVPQAANMRVGKTPDGGEDLLNVIESYGGVPGPGRVMTAEYNGYEDAFGYGAARKLRRAPSKGGGNIDTIITQYAAQGYRFDSVDEFYVAVRQASEERKRMADAIEKLEYGAKFDAALFGNVGRAAALKARKAVNSASLNEGDTFAVATQKVRVKAVDEDGTIHVANGVKRSIPPDTEIFPDKGKVDRVKLNAPAAGEDANPFDPAPRAGAGVAAPRAAAAPGEVAMPAPPAGTPMGTHRDGAMPVAMERILPGEVDVPTIMDALEDVIRVVGGHAPIRKGRFYAQARGIYKVREDVIRLNHADNIPTAAHEVAHAVSKHIFGGTGSTKITAALRSSSLARLAIGELRNLGRQLYGNTRPVAGYTAEGFSELMRLWLTTEDAPRRAPSATRWLETELLAQRPGLADALRTARDQIDIWRGQGAAGRAAAQMKGPPGRLARLRDFVKNNLGRAAQVEEFAPLEAFGKGFFEITGRKLRPSEDPFLVASSVRKIAGPVIEAMVERGMQDIWGNVTGPGLKEAFKRIAPHDAEKFSHYLWARRAIERWGKNKNPSMALEDAKHLRQTLETPEFIEAATKYYAWWRGVLEYVKMASPETNGAAIDAIFAASFDFVPLGKVLDPAKVKASAAGAAGAGLKRMMGSGLPIKEIYLQSLMVAERLIVKAHRDMVVDSIINLSQQPGMGWLVEKVPRTRVMESINIERIRAQLEELGIDTATLPADELLSFTSYMDTPKGTDPIVARKTPAGVEWYQLPADVYELLQGVEAPARLGWAFELIFGAPGRAFKLGVTGLNASFSLVTNPARDFPTYMLQSIAGNPLSRATAYFRSLANILRAGFGGKDSAELEQFHRLGISAANYLGGDVQQAKRAAKGLFHGKTWRMIRTPVETLREGLGFFESVPRVAEMTLIGRELGWKPGQKLTPDQAVAMRMGGRRVTTDFPAAGSIGRELNRAMPFYNPAIQGTRGFLRAFGRDQGWKEKRHAMLKALLNGLTLLTLPAFYNWWHNKDEEWHRMLPYRERNLYLSAERAGTVFQVPLAPDWAGAFITLPISALDAAWHKDPEVVYKAVGHMFTMLNPASYPTLVAAGKTQWSNRVDFFDRPVVPRGELDLLPGMQRSPYSSWLAKTLGDVFPGQVSPRKVDAALRDVFGGLGYSVADSPAAFQRALGLQPDKQMEREFEPADIPVLGRLFRHGGKITANNQVLIDYWDDLDKYSAWFRSNERAINNQKPVLMPMSHAEQAYAQQLEDWTPILRISLDLAALTPEIARRQELYKRATDQARAVMRRRPAPAGAKP